MKEEKRDKRNIKKQMMMWEKKEWAKKEKTEKETNKRKKEARKRQNETGIKME